MITKNDLKKRRPRMCGSKLHSRRNIERAHYLNYKVMILNTNAKYR